jgi:hypothetical protein
LVVLFWASLPAAAWTPQTQLAIADEAAGLTPPDLARQLKKRKRVFEAGVLAPFSEPDPARHFKHPDGTGSLDRTLLEEVDRAIFAIRSHHPFDEVTRQLGTVAHFVADANNPLASSADDADMPRYFVDYLRYAESAMGRFPLVFYGLEPQTERAGDLTPIVQQALQRGRALYPLIGEAYREIDYASGVGAFDDRSTAFGAASVSFSHAVTDIAQVLRYIWLRAGGVDQRPGLPTAGTRLLLLPRADLGR